MLGSIRKHWEGCGKHMGSFRNRMGSVGKPMGSMREEMGSILIFLIMFNFSFGVIGTIWVLIGNFEIFLIIS